MRRVSFAVAVAALVPTAQVAHATEYLSLAQAQHQMFPDATAFEPVVLMPALPQRLAWRAVKDGSTLGWFVADAVIGKLQLINYAVAFAPDGRIRQVEILAYRESHGGEVRNDAWRAQFDGKDSHDPLTLGSDIRNISGATLSCTHLTEGIKRMAAAVAPLVAQK